MYSQECERLVDKALRLFFDLLRIFFLSFVIGFQRNYPLHAPQLFFVVRALAQASYSQLALLMKAAKLLMPWCTSKPQEPLTYRKQLSLKN